MSVIRSVVVVDPARRAQWLMPSAMRRVNPEEIHYLLPVDAAGTWSAGDLLLGEVSGALGLVSSVQNTSRRSELSYRDATLYPGSKLVAVLAPRAGSSTCIASVPERPLPELHLHGVGGQAGIVDVASQHAALYTRPPTALSVLAQLGDAEGKPLNMRRFGVEVSGERIPRGPDDPALILVVGSDMDAGKTTTARRVIYSLRAMGHKVVAGKATGVASLYDIASMFDAGASEVFDFADLGEPTTIGLPADDVLTVFHKIFNRLRGRAGRDGYVVLEFADGIWYRETKFLLEDASVRDLVSHVVYACHSILDAEHGVEVLHRLGYGQKLKALSGRLGSSGVLRGLAPGLLTRQLPIFDSMDYTASPEDLVGLLDM